MCQYIFILFFPDEFQDVIKKTQQHQKFPFDFDCGFVKRFFGNDKKREVPYHEFAQLLEV